LPKRQNQIAAFWKDRQWLKGKNSKERGPKKTKQEKSRKFLQLRILCRKNLRFAISGKTVK